MEEKDFADNEEVLDETSNDTVAEGVNENQDNTSEIKVGETNEIDNEETNEPKTKDSTKEYSERLKKDREKIRQELEKEQASKLDAIARSRGFENWEELEEESNKQQIEDLGITDVDAFNKYLNEAIANNPEMIKAKRVLQEQEARESEKRLEEEIAKIGQLDPNIKNVNDLLNHPTYEAILNRVKNGQTVLDAYKLENFEMLTLRQTESAKQSVYNNINNKSHVKTSKGAVTKDVVVPQDVYIMYKRNLPSWSDEQIKKHYAKEVGGGI